MYYVVRALMTLPCIPIFSFFDALTQRGFDLAILAAFRTSKVDSLAAATAVGSPPTGSKAKRESRRPVDGGV